MPFCQSIDLVRTNDTFYWLISSKSPLSQSEALSKIACEEHVKEASSLIQSFFSNFTEIYGTNMQSYNFHSMRHLFNQVRRVGPLWNTSAFSYESANHFLVKNVAGTVKSPEAIVEAFLKSKEVFMYDGTEPDFETLKNFSKVSTDCHNFCKNFPDPQDFFGRFRTPDGVILSSLSYSRLNDN